MRHLAVIAGLLLAACSGPATPTSTAAQTRDEATPSPAELVEPEPPVVEPAAPDTWVASLLEQHPDKFGRLLADPARHRLQILVTLVPDAGAEPPTLIEHGYRVGEEFIYPASSIKTFASVAALLKLQDLQAAGHPVDLTTPLAICRVGARRCTIAADPSNLEGGLITLGHEIRKMQLVSDNQAFNRLYDFVGQRELDESLWALGFVDLRVHHRMFDSDDPILRRTTPRMELRPAGGAPVIIEERISDLELPPTPARELALGRAHIDEDGVRVEQPLSFADKNYASIRDLHRLTIALVMPQAPGALALGLSPAHREFLLAAMSEDPLESRNPVYADEAHAGLRYKTMLSGIGRVLPIERIHYVNKPGRAYGFHLDAAYVEDTRSRRAMFVTVVIYANANEVLNDDEYEYDEVTRPFLDDLGEVLARAWLLDE